MVFGFSKLFLRISMIKMPPKQRKHIKIETDSIKTPENYPVAYDNIRIMRKDMSAPVDTMGCEKVKNSSDEPKVFRDWCSMGVPNTGML